MVLVLLVTGLGLSLPQASHYQANHSDLLSHLTSVPRLISWYQTETHSGCLTPYSGLSDRFESAVYHFYLQFVDVQLLPLFCLFCLDLLSSLLNSLSI